MNNQTSLPGLQKKQSGQTSIISGQNSISSSVSWIKGNLFSSPLNSLLTLIATVVSLIILKGLLGFLFSSERKWDAVATNMRLMMTQAYPQDQYIRIWVATGTIMALIGLSSAIWNTGREVPSTKVATFIIKTASFIILLTCLAPLSSNSKILTIAVCGTTIPIALALKHYAIRNISSLVLISGMGVLIIVALWVIPFGHYALVNGEYIAENRTVAITTKLPWTVMLIITFAAYQAGRVVRRLVKLNLARSIMLFAWLLSPMVLVYLVLRDPDFDWGHIMTTDGPIFLIYALLGSILLLWLSHPSTGEIGRVVSALVLIAGFASFLTPMRMVIRILLLILAIFSLAAPTFAGNRTSRKHYTFAWIATAGVLCWLITAINTPSTLNMRADFFLGGFSLTLMVAVLTLMFSFPFGVLLALGRTSSMPIFRLLSTWFIELVRGIPLISILIFFSVMVPLFLPKNMDLPEITAVVLGYSLFSGAYLAENVRGGLQSVTRGQHEAAEAVGMTTSQKTAFIVLPQALRVAIPPLVGQCIAVFKETSLLYIIGLFDLLTIGKRVVPAQTEFIGSMREMLLFVSLIYWVFCYQMSKSSQRLEKRVGLGER